MAFPSRTEVVDFAGTRNMVANLLPLVDDVEIIVHTKDHTSYDPSSLRAVYYKDKDEMVPLLGMSPEAHAVVAEDGSRNHGWTVSFYGGDRSTFEWHWPNSLPEPEDVPGWQWTQEHAEVPFHRPPGFFESPALRRFFPTTDVPNFNDTTEIQLEDIELPSP